MIQSIERAFSILELFRDNNNNGLGISEISRRLDLPKSTTFGLVDSLYKLGYLEKNSADSRYYLGLKFLTYKNLINPHENLIKIVHPHLEELVSKFNETAHFAYKLNNRVIYIDKVDSDEELFFKTAIGKENYLHSTAVGKCILANQDFSQVQAVLDEGLVKLTDFTITDKDVFIKELDKIKSQGYAIDNQEGSIGLICHAVPLFINGKCNSSISISSPILRMDDNRNKQIINALLSIRHEIESKYN